MKDLIGYKRLLRTFVSALLVQAQESDCYTEDYKNGLIEAYKGILYMIS